MTQEILKVAGAIGTFFGIASAFLLIQQGYELGLSAPLKIVFSYYDAGVKLFAGLLEPVFDGALFLLALIGDWKFSLRPGWHHVFVATMGIAAAMLRTQAVFRGAENRWEAMLFLVWRFMTISTALMCVVIFARLAFAPIQSGRALTAVDQEGIGYAVYYGSGFLVGAMLLRLVGHSEVMHRAAYALGAVPAGVVVVLFANAGLSVISGL